MNKDKFVKLLYRAILDVMCISEEMLNSSSRKAKICDTRKIFCYLCREENIPYQTIGKFLNRNHSTLVIQMSDFEEYLKLDKVLWKSFFEVKSYLEKLKKENE